MDVEQAARIMFAHMNQGSYSQGWERCNPSLRLRYLRAARAVLINMVDGKGER